MCAGALLDHADPPGPDVLVPGGLALEVLSELIQSCPLPGWGLSASSSRRRLCELQDREEDGAAQRDSVLQMLSWDDS